MLRLNDTHNWRVLVLYIVDTTWKLVIQRSCLAIWRSTRNYLDILGRRGPRSILGILETRSIINFWLGKWIRSVINFWLSIRHVHRLQIQPDDALDMEPVIICIFGQRGFVVRLSKIFLVPSHPAILII